MSTAEKVVNHELKEPLVVYEVGYLLLSTMPEERLAEVVGTIHSAITAQGGVVIAEELPKMRALAYEMPKMIKTKRHMFDHAYFGWVKFEAESAHLASIKKSVEALDEMLRALFIKTVRESTLIGNKLVARDAKKDEGETAKVPGQEEEIDKSIEALVTN